LLEPEILTKVIAIRRMFDALEKNDGATEMIIEQMRKTKSNAEFMAKVVKK